MENWYFQLLIHVLELITAIVATVNFKKYQFSTEKYFLYFFWLIFILDTAGAIVSNFFELKNFFIHNTLFLYYFIFLLYWYYSILKLKILFISFFTIYLFFVVFNLAKVGYNETLHIINFTSGVILVLISSFIYFFSILKDNSLLNIRNSLPFWITIGNIIYFVGILPLIILQNYLNLNTTSYDIVLTILNLSTYACYILGFIWMKKQ